MPSRWQGRQGTGGRVTRLVTPTADRADPVPSRVVLDRADADYDRTQLQSEGFLSEVGGFLPRRLP